VSVVVTTGKAYETVRDKLVDSARRLAGRVRLDTGVTMGPVVSARHKERVLTYVEAGRKDGATLLLDGRATKVDKYPKGHFVGPTVFDGVRPDMTIGHEEIFGPVASVTRAATWTKRSTDPALALRQRDVDLHDERSLGARVPLPRGVSMIGVNIGVAAPDGVLPVEEPRARSSETSRLTGRTRWSFTRTKKS